MTPVLPCSFGSVTLLTKATFSPRKEIRLVKCDAYQRSLKDPPANRRIFISRSVSIGLIQRYRGSFSLNKIQILAAVGTDVATEETNPAVSEESVEEIPENSPALTESDDKQPSPFSVSSTARSKRSRPTKKSDMPAVKNEELVPGASFTGKVRSIQPFGAFVDIGAFTDGLVHVSKLSEGFVKDVASVVSVGQEVKVKIVEVNMESGRISLTMRDDSTTKLQQKKDSSKSSENERPRTPRKNVGGSRQKRDEAQKSSKFVKGQVLDGTVKNLTRSGAYVSLPDGEEGFLPLEEESEGFGNILGSSSLQVGQEINVRVLRISRGQATLTMKKEEDVEAINKQLNQGVVHTATNPFVVAFRKNKDIATFLEEREKTQQPEIVSLQQSKEEDSETLIDETDTITLEDSVIGDENVENTLDYLQNEDLSNASLPRDEDGPATSMFEGSVSSDDTDVVKASEESGTKETDSSIEASGDGVDEDNSSKVVISPDADSSMNTCVPETVAASTQEIESQAETQESVAVDDNTTSEMLASQETDSVEKPIEPIAVDGHTALEALDSQQTDSVAVFDTDTNSVKADGSVDDSVIDDTSSTDILNSDVSQTEPIPDNEVSTTSTQATNSEVLKPVLASEVVENEESNNSNDQNFASASISPTLVKKLREETGAGMMDCKKDLAETGGDIVKAQEFLRKKGLASADKKASRATAEGRIGSYIHDNRIGVLIEVNCETDFVARGDIFKELADDLAMQVAACPQVSYLVTEDVPEETVAKEKEIEMQREDLLKKPEQIREKIVEGRIRKRLEEFALLEQPYIKNDKVVVKDWVKQTIATVGENIKVKRFVRYNLGEGLEKKSQDFASEVAAQTAVKPTPVMPKDQPEKAEDAGEKPPPSVVVSAALVKQLRDETGAGMMNCKKALAETGGDLEKAQEYLRKKGLSSADKKSSRLAAEGRISSYIHDSRIGVLIEVNCETDFVARNEKFKVLVDDLAMQVVACPQVAFVSVDEIPESITSHEKEIEMQREDLKSKPENIREKIVEGRVSKRLGELALLEQPFIKDDSLLVKDLVKQTIAALGENIRIRRFVKFNLGD